MVVILWLVDDGFPKRTHRLNIMGPDLTSVGIASGDHAAAIFCNIAVFAA